MNLSDQVSSHPVAVLQLHILQKPPDISLGESSSLYKHDTAERSAPSTAKTAGVQTITSALEQKLRLTADSDEKIFDAIAERLETAFSPTASESQATQPYRVHLTLLDVFQDHCNDLPLCKEYLAGLHASHVFMLRKLNGGFHISALQPYLSEATHFANTFLDPEKQPYTEEQMQRLEKAFQLVNDYNKGFAKNFVATWQAEMGKYHPENNGKYPIRDSHDKPVHISWIAPKSELNLTGRKYTSKAVKKFFASVTPEKRSALYEGLACETFEERDKQHPSERVLVGQKKVVFKRAYKQGECLGVYSGRIFDRKFSIDDTYAAELYHEDGLFIDGDAILSKMNTSFAYDRLGYPCSQKQTGYTVDGSVFKATLDGNQSVGIKAFFATRDTVPGEEARWNYGYTPQSIQRKFGKPVSSPSETTGE